MKFISFMIRQMCNIYKNSFVGFAELYIFARKRK